MLAYHYSQTRLSKWSIYSLRSLYFKNKNNTKTSRVKLITQKQVESSFILHVKIQGVLWWKIKVIKKRLTQEKTSLKRLPIECIEEVGKEDKVKNISSQEIRETAKKQNELKLTWNIKGLFNNVLVSANTNFQSRGVNIRKIGKEKRKQNNP